MSIEKQMSIAETTFAPKVWIWSLRSKAFSKISKLLDFPPQNKRHIAHRINGNEEESFTTLKSNFLNWCVEVYHRHYRFVFVSEMEMADYPLAYDISPYLPPFLSRARARGMLDGRFAGRRYRRESRGIHEECCINGCTINELTSYCGP